MAVFRIDSRQRRPLLWNESAKKHNDGGRRSSAQKSICPEFSEQYARAREAQADKLAEETLAIADEDCTMVRADKHGSRDDDGEGNTEVVFDATAVARNRLRVDARKWLASKMAPKKYGDKLAVGGADDLGPVQTVNRNLTDAERAVRLSRAINDNPAAMQALLAAMAKKGAAK